MKSVPQPLRCRPQAYALFATQAGRLNHPDALVTGAVAVAMHEMQDADVDAVEADLHAMTERIRRRVTSDNPQAILAHAHDVLFEEEAFVGNIDDYHNPCNSYLPAVLQTRRGIPITLSMVYKRVVERLGLAVHGINAPGHFLVAVQIPGESNLLVIDPFFSGRAMSAQEAAERAQQVMGRPVAQPQMLIQPATHRQWLGRMLNNLHGIFTQRQRADDAAAMEELRLLLEPGD